MLSDSGNVCAALNIPRESLRIENDEIYHTVIMYISYMIMHGDLLLDCSISDCVVSDFM